MKSFSFVNYLILFLVLITIYIFYNRFEYKRLREESEQTYNAIQKYLLDDITLAKSKKTILWIHVPYEYNSRKWLSFGSRSSYDLNQPYLYLTVKSIIQKCDNSFTICIIDDNSFKKLIPNWNINMSMISEPISSNIRKLALMKLLYKYGGLLCPLSFLCMKDLISLYEKGSENNTKMFVCENVNHNITSTSFNFFSDMTFMGAPKENDILKQLIDFTQRIISKDYTSASVFLGDFDRWIEKKIQMNEINMINGIEIGIKTVDNKPILLDDLMANNYLNIGTQIYGIYIPSKEILNRTNFEWFARLSQKQVLESNTIIGNYILVSIAPNVPPSILEPLETRPNWVGFWKIPSDAPYYGLKPNNLGNNIKQIPYPSS